MSFLEGLGHSLFGLLVGFGCYPGRLEIWRLLRSVWNYDVCWIVYTIVGGKRRPRVVLLKVLEGESSREAKQRTTKKNCVT